MSEEMMEQIAEAITAIAAQIKWLGNGDASTRMGAIEAHGLAVKEGLEAVARAIEELARAVEDRIP